MKDLRGLTGLRGIAAFAVLLFHLVFTYLFTTRPTHAGFLWGTDWGWIGVDLFFVLSGFLLAVPILEAPGEVRRPGFFRAYMIRRWWRLAPAFYASIPLALILTGSFPYLWNRPGDLLKHVAFLHNASFPTASSINLAYWTLANEFQLYLALPLLVALSFRSRRLWILGALFLSSLAWRYGDFVAHGAESWLSFLPFAFLCHFVVGVLTARLYVRGWRPPMPGLATLALIAVGGLALGFFVGPNTFLHGEATLWGSVLLRPILAFVFAGIVLCAAQPSPWLERALGCGPLQQLGRRSYTLYLTHSPMLILLSRQDLLLQNGFLPFAFVGLAATLGLAWLFYGAIEGPSLVLRRRVLRKPAGPLPVREPAIDGAGAGPPNGVPTLPTGPSIGGRRDSRPNPFQMTASQPSWKSD